jgi:hypothetical protein
MKMKIEFSMDNAVMAECPEMELEKIFSDIVSRSINLAETGRGIQDSNGNRIGQWTVED